MNGLEYFASMGVPVKVSPYMVGQKKAVMLNGVVYLSPAMWDLTRNASAEELHHLLIHLPLLNLGTMPDPFATGGPFSADIAGRGEGRSIDAIKWRSFLDG